MLFMGISASCMQNDNQFGSVLSRGCTIDSLIGRLHLIVIIQKGVYARIFSIDYHHKAEKLRKTFALVKKINHLHLITINYSETQYTALLTQIKDS